jgi:hypothetical protein
MSSGELQRRQALGLLAAGTAAPCLPAEPRQKDFSMRSRVR